MMRWVTVISPGLAGFLSIFLCLTEHPATAHDGWIEVSPAIVERGQLASIALIQGNHSNEHRSYRVAGVGSKYTTLYILDPKGKQLRKVDGAASAQDRTTDENGRVT